MTGPAAGGGAQAARGLQAPTHLMCELLLRPEESLIATAQPHFAWQVNDDRPGAVQSAYRIRVATTPQGATDGPTDVWDSGQVASGQSLAVPYGGPPLQPNSVYWWTVVTCDAAGASSPVSAPQRFRTARRLHGSRPRPIEIQWVHVEEEDRWALPNCVSPALYTETADAVDYVARGRWFADFRHDAFGTLAFTATVSASAKPNSQRMTVRLGEKSAGRGYVESAPGGSVRFRETYVDLKAGKNRYEIEFVRATHGVHVPAHLPEVMPFRYVEFEATSGVSAVTDIQRSVMHVPFDNAASAFRSSNDALNAVWDFCKHTIRATTFLGIYVDGDRERLPYEADAYINQLGHYCTDREYAVARRTHEHLIFSPTWPTEWILHSIPIAWADYLYTGDASALAARYGDLCAKTLRVLAREDGLIGSERAARTAQVLHSVHLHQEMKDIVDWPECERDGFEFREVNAVVNAFHVHAAGLMGPIARAAGHAGDGAEWDAHAARLREAFHSAFFDSKRGVYVDGAGSSHASLHANMFPLAFGLVPSPCAASVAAFVKSRGMACSVYGAQYLLEALFRAGEDDYAIGLMTDPRTDRSWLHMLRGLGATMTLEAWDARYKSNLDWNHAWGAAPANILPRKVLGVEPLEPGFRVVGIEPHIGSLRSVSGHVPTPRGPVHVGAERRDGAAVWSFGVPANSRARILLPAAAPSDITDGTTGRPLGETPGVSVAPTGQGRVAIEAASGVHRFVVCEKR